ncbi:RNA 2',3'-cyclic phosphodiesterase [Streptomyces alkaliphilus]|uniref:RNA 2',3'-cyclic phosphodiesterase n=1 Tax=Streptomyces alkaliphilus TaxID=1472722 RepID=A0A7W3THP0_9ACTN|nr:2'-5' RNA ligase family protein [Streptomyces alkaliphilus]MBB0247026.1 RNA 2',3'-cyclic phosphodiesterase [Streptomyces alkaliphilus]
MRLFSALLPPEAVLRRVAEITRELRDLPEAGRVRWTDPAGWHITLAFHGECPDGILPDLGERLGRAARRSAPFHLRLTSGGRFGDRALWLGVADARPRLDPLPPAGDGGKEVVSSEPGGPPLAGAGRPPREAATGRDRPVVRLAEACRAAGARAGAPHRETVPFRPHLTLARSRGGAGRAMAVLAGVPGDVIGEAWLVDRLVLIRSELPSGAAPGAGPRYTPLLARELGTGRAVEATNAGG